MILILRNIQTLIFLIDMKVTEFDILSMRFRCKQPLDENDLKEHLIKTTAQECVCYTSTVRIDEASSLSDTVYEMYSKYEKVIEKLREQQGKVYLYITHHTQRARELVIPNQLLRFLVEKEILVQVD